MLIDALIVELVKYAQPKPDEYHVYGPLNGTVERISADSFTDDRDRTFYRVTVRTEQNHVEKDGVLHPILPGMVASVDILTGRKSVLEYL